MRSDMEVLLYRAIKELEYVQEMSTEFVESEHRCLIASGEGRDVISEGMGMLGIKQLGWEEDEFRGTSA